MNDATQMALITGAGSGIGQAIATALAAQGMGVCLVGRNRDRLEQTAEIAARTASPVQCITADLENDTDIHRLADELAGVTERLDVLVHSAGYFSMGPLASVDVAEFDRLYRVNVRAPYLLTQLLLPALRRAQGQVVFINSSAGYHKAGAGISQYAASKYALRAVADSLRQEVNPDGMRVLSIYPGRVATTMQATVRDMEGGAYEPAKLMQPGDVAEAVTGALAMPRSAEVTDIHIRSSINP